MKVYDLTGYKCAEISNSNDNSYFIDTFYDYKIKKHFIITTNLGVC